VSNHIKILTECELVKQEEKGREIYYRINANKMKDIDKWIEQFKNILQTQFSQLDKVLLTLKKNNKK
jgi:DNA-binding transcriptional ArsR family regulator